MIFKAPILYYSQIEPESLLDRAIEFVMHILL